jgi:hypothetical protein
MGCIGGLLLLPLVIAFGLMTLVVGFVAEKGCLWRLLGVLASLAIGGVCILVGYSFGIEGTTELVGSTYQQVTMPVVGWVDMIGGGLIAIIGIYVALLGKKEKTKE